MFHLFTILGPLLIVVGTVGSALELGEDPRQFTPLLSANLRGVKRPSAAKIVGRQGLLYGERLGQIRQDVRESVAPTHVDGTPRMNVTSPPTGDRISAIRRPR